MSHSAAGMKLRALSLHTKLIVALTMLVALVVAGFTYVVIERERSRALGELEARASGLASLLSRSLALPLWNVDFAALEHQLGALSEDAEIAEVSVTAVNYGSVSKVTRVQETDPSATVVRVRPIEHTTSEGSPAEKIGEVTVVFSRARTDMAIARFRNAILLIAAAIIVGLYVATFVLLNRMVGRPIHRLEEMVDRIAGGDLQARCQVASGDELGRLAARVNDMADRLASMLRSLRTSEAKLEEAQRIAHVGYWDRDLDTDLFTASEETHRIFGQSPRADAMSFAVALELVHPDDRHRLTESVAEALRGGPRYDVEYRVIRADGAVRFVHSQGDLTRDDTGRPRRMFGTVQDITDRKRAEDALQRSEHYLAEAQRLSHTGSWAYNAATEQEMYWSEEMFRIYGLDPQRDTAPGLDEIARFWHPDDRNRVLEHVRAKTREGAHYAVEHRLLLPDGAIKHVHVTCHPVFDSAGVPVEYVGTVMDITERKRAEEAALEARLGERTRIARELHDTLLQSFHGVLLRFQTAANRLPEHPMEAKATLDSAIAQAAKAVTEGRDAVQALRGSTAQPDDLAAAIRMLGEELANESTDQPPPLFHLSVEGEPRDMHPVIRDEIYKITAESMRNAFRHADARHVAVEVRHEDAHVRLRVRDDGKGIDPGLLARKGRDGHYGLSGMHERARIVGGQLKVTSDVGAGTTVELCIPAASVPS